MPRIGMRAPGALASLICGILGLFICGFAFGWVAIQQADQAKQAIASDPNLTGEGMATAGKVIGIIAIAGWALVVIGRAVSR